VRGRDADGWRTRRTRTIRATGARRAIAGEHHVHERVTGGSAHGEATRLRPPWEQMSCRLRPLSERFYQSLARRVNSIVNLREVPHEVLFARCARDARWSEGIPHSLGDRTMDQPEQGSLTAAAIRRLRHIIEC
jgi:hypothetical protein